MKTTVTISIILTSTLFLSACTGLQKNQATTNISQLSYLCQSEETLRASYPTADSAIVEYKGVKHSMKIAISASGSRYVGDNLEWWTKGSGLGSDGSLFRHLAGGKTGEGLENCKQI